MQLWPVSPPNHFCIPPRCSERDKIDDDLDILATIPLTHSNVVIIITKTRVLVYNFKPFALVAAHERTSESLAEFGDNKGLVPSIAFRDKVSGVTDSKPPTYMSWYQGKLVFYTTTTKNYVLAYQVLRNSTSESIFKDYGLPIIEVSQINEFESAAYDANLDDDVLTVFDKVKSSKVIQNGYVLNKDRGILQFLSAKSEDPNEIPIKKLELRLKVVFKFEYDIIDFIGFKRFSDEDDGKFEENLLALFADKIQLLKLQDFKFNSSQVVEIANSKKICICDNKLYVISQDKETKKLIIHLIDLNEQKVLEKTEHDCNSELVNAFSIGSRMLVSTKDSVNFFCTEKNQFTYHRKFDFSIKLAEKLTDECFVIITENDRLEICSKFGNKLFSTISEDDSSSNKIHNDTLNYTALVYIDKTLITTCESGYYQIWNFWQEFPQSTFDFRVPKVSAIANNNNDIKFYSSSGDSPLNRIQLQSLKLPTKSLNNNISHIKLNSNLKLVAINISNKNSLLIQNLETSLWYQFTDVHIIDMHWIANNYLVCHLKEYNSDTVSVKCYNLPLKGLENYELEDLEIWAYEIPENVDILKFWVNTHHKYKYLKMKNQKLDSSELSSSDRFFKTAEIILSTSSSIVVFDVISKVQLTGLNTIVNIHQYSSLEIANSLPTRTLEWVSTWKDGFIIYASDMLFRLEKLSDGTIHTTQLLDNVEKIVDVVKHHIYMVQEDKFTIYDINGLWEDRKPILSIKLDEEHYPICISSDAAIVQSLYCVFNKNLSKLIMKNSSYLDKLISVKIDRGDDLYDISRQFSNLKHYKFALEKNLSIKLMEGESITKTLELIKLLNDKPTGHGKISRYSDMLEIISNCLRKSEMKNWKTLFDDLSMSPRELLALCIDNRESKMLGVLLLVFLNYGETEVLGDIQEEKPVELHNPTMDDVLKDEELMFKVLKHLVESSASSSNAIKASEEWELCLQLVRLLKALDKENNTNLMEKATQIILKS